MIDLSHLNRFVQPMRLMETRQSVLRAVQRNDWMFSIDLKDAYIQVLIHRPSLPLVCCRWTGVSVQSPLLWPLHGPSGFYQGHGSCVSHPSRHGRPDTPVSGRLVGPRLIQSRSPVGKGQSPRPLSSTWHSGEPWQISSDPLAFCHLSGDVSGEPLFEGFSLAGEGLDPEVTAQRVFVLQAPRHRSLAQSSGSSLLSLPSHSGRVSSDALPSVRTTTSVGFCGQVSSGPLDPQDRTGPLVVLRHRPPGVSLEVQHPDLLFWSDASDQGWGVHLHDQFVSGRWSPEERSLSINLRELRVIRLGLMHFGQSLWGMTVGIFTDNTTTLSYVKRQAGTFSMALNQEAHHLLRWSESLDLSLVPQFIVGAQNVVADSLSRRHQVLNSEWTLAQEIVDELVARWPATVDLFATALNYWLRVYFSPPPILWQWAQMSFFRTGMDCRHKPSHLLCRSVRS